MRGWMFTARESKGLTIKQVASALGITEGYYSLIENGKRQKKLDMTTAIKLSSVFGMSVQEIADAENMEGA